MIYIAPFAKGHTGADVTSINCKLMKDKCHRSHFQPMKIVLTNVPRLILVVEITLLSRVQNRI